MTWTSVGPEPLGFLNNQNPPNRPITTNGVGNLVVCINTMHSDTGVYPTGMSSSRVTWAKVPGTDIQDLANSFTGLTNWSGNLWLGTVNSTGSDTVVFSYTGGAVPAHTNCVMQEFNSSVGSWSVDTWASFNTSTGQSTWPGMTAAGAGELYMGFAWNSGANTGGASNPPWVFNSNSDSQANAMAYNLNYSSGTFPTWSDATEMYGMTILVQESSLPPQPPGPPMQSPLLGFPFQQQARA